MWRRKPEDEITRIKRRRLYRANYAFLTPVVYALASAAIYLLLSWAGWHGKLHPWTAPIAFTDALADAVRFLVFALLAFGALHLLRLPRRASASEPAVICDRCHAVTAGEVGSRCSCGGSLEPLAHWRWIPSKSDPRENA